MIQNIIEQNLRASLQKNYLNYEVIVSGSSTKIKDKMLFRPD